MRRLIKGSMVEVLSGDDGAFIEGFRYPKVDSPDGYLMKTNGSKVLGFQNPANIGGFSRIGTNTTPSAVSSVVFNNLPPNRYFKIYGDHISSSVNNDSFFLQFSVNNGVTWLSGTNFYYRSILLQRDTQLVGASGVDSTGLVIAANIANTDDMMFMLDMTTTNTTIALGEFSRSFYTHNAGSQAQYIVSGSLTQAAGVPPPVNAIRFIFTGGTIRASARFDVYSMFAG